jgi:hypothetical protein
MKIGAIADTHDNLYAIAEALDAFQEAGVETILHAGDFVAPFALKALMQTRLPIHAVFGNCDGEKAGLAKLLPAIAAGPLHLELGGRKVCLVHAWETLSHETIEASDIIIFGHTHEPKVE